MYFVVIEANPYDCMGECCKVSKFESKEEAIKYFKNPFGDDYSAKCEFIDVFGFEPDEDDPEAIFIAIGTIYLFTYEKNIFELDEALSKGEYDIWMDDYDGEMPNFLADFLHEKGAKLITSSDFEYIITNDDLY